MVLIDTSIWLRFLADRAPEAEHAEYLMRQQAILGHDLVYGELLIGDRGTRSPLLERLTKAIAAPTVTHDKMISFVRDRRLMAQGLSWIDAHLLAAALVAHARLWTADDALQQAAIGLGIGYQIG
jgi:predicted nucleic acid-binding protein